MNTINSIKKQTYRNYEIIIVDGLSNDGTIEEIKNKFSDVLKSSGSYVKSGSPTAIRQQFAKDLGKNPISTATGGIPVLSTLDDFFFSRD